MSFWLTYTACKTSYVHVGYCWVLNKHKTMTLRYNALQYGECYLPTYRTRTQPQQLTYIIESAFNGSKHPAPYPRSPEASRFLDKPLFIRSTAYDLPLNLVSKIISTFQFKGSLKHALIFSYPSYSCGYIMVGDCISRNKIKQALGNGLRVHMENEC